MEYGKISARIKRTKNVNAKNDIYMSVYGSDRQGVLEAIIVRMPKGSRRIDDFCNEISDVAGYMAATDVDKKIMLGLACTQPKRVKVSFTHGLDEITIL